MIYFEQDKIFAVKKSEKTEIIMTKTELEAFLAVLQYGSISAAAERLFITQPAMSRRMKSMEEELGYSLLSVDAVREAWNLQRMEKNSFRSRNAC